MKTLSTMLALAILVGTAQGETIDIFVVATDTNETGNLIAHLNDNYSNVGSITEGKYADGAPPAVAGDLVIFSRDANSGDYDDSNAERDSWNNLPCNMLMLNAYLVRDANASGGSGDELGWLDQGTQDTAATAGFETAVLDAGDPLFAGVTVTAGFADLYDVTTSSGTGQPMNAGIAAGASAGGGTVLATDADGRALMGRWATGAALATVNGTATVHGGPRIYLAWDDNNDSASEASDAGYSELTADGLRVFDNALVEFGLVPVPEPGTLSLLAVFGGLLLLMRRKVGAR